MALNLSFRSFSFAPLLFSRFAFIVQVQFLLPYLKHSIRKNLIAVKLN